MNPTRLALTAAVGVLLCSAQAIFAATDTTINDGSTLVESSRNVTLSANATNTLYDISNGSRIEIPGGVTVNFTDTGTGTAVGGVFQDSSLLIAPGGTLSVTENGNGQSNGIQFMGFSDAVIGGTYTMTENDNGGGTGLNIQDNSTFATLSGAVINVTENGGNQANGIGILVSDNATAHFASGTTFTVLEGSGNGGAAQQARLFRANGNADITIEGGTYSVEQNNIGDLIFGNARFDSTVTILGGSFSLDEAGNGDARFFLAEGVDDSSGNVDADSFGGYITIAGGTFTAVQGGNGDYFDLEAIEDGVIELIGTDFSEPFGPLTGTGMVSGTFADGNMFNFSYTTSGNGQILLTEAAVAAVPEPSSIALWSLLAVVGVACRMWRKRRA